MVPTAVLIVCCDLKGPIRAKAKRLIQVARRLPYSFNYLLFLDDTDKHIKHQICFEFPCNLIMSLRLKLQQCGHECLQAPRNGHSINPRMHRFLLSDIIQLYPHDMLRCLSSLHLKGSEDQAQPFQVLLLPTGMQNFKQEHLCRTVSQEDQPFPFFIDSPEERDPQELFPSVFKAAKDFLSRQFQEDSISLHSIMRSLRRSSVMLVVGPYIDYHGHPYTRIVAAVTFVMTTDGTMIEWIAVQQQDHEPVYQIDNLTGYDSATHYHNFVGQRRWAPFLYCIIQNLAQAGGPKSRSSCLHLQGRYLNYGFAVMLAGGFCYETRQLNTNEKHMFPICAQDPRNSLPGELADLARSRKLSYFNDCSKLRLLVLRESICVTFPPDEQFRINEYTYRWGLPPPGRSQEDQGAHILRSIQKKLGGLQDCCFEDMVNASTSPQEEFIAHLPRDVVIPNHDCNRENINNHQENSTSPWQSLANSILTALYGHNHNFSYEEFTTCMSALLYRFNHLHATDGAIVDNSIPGDPVERKQLLKTHDDRLRNNSCDITAFDVQLIRRCFQSHGFGDNIRRDFAILSCSRDYKGVNIHHTTTTQVQRILQDECVEHSQPHLYIIGRCVAGDNSVTYQSIFSHDQHSEPSLISVVSPEIPTTNTYNPKAEFCKPRRIDSSQICRLMVTAHKWNPHHYWIGFSKKAKNVEISLEREWVQKNFEQWFIDECHNKPGRVLKVVPGAPDDLRDAIKWSPSLINKTQPQHNNGIGSIVPFQQRNYPLCLVYSFASALLHFNMRTEATNFADQGFMLVMDGKLTVKSFIGLVQKHCKAHDFIRDKTYPVSLHPQSPVSMIFLSSDGSIGHAVALLGNRIYDSTEQRVLPNCAEALDRCAGLGATFCKPENAYILIPKGHKKLYGQHKLNYFFSQTPSEDILRRHIILLVKSRLKRTTLQCVGLKILRALHERPQGLTRTHLAHAINMKHTSSMFCSTVHNFRNVFPPLIAHTDVTNKRSPYILTPNVTRPQTLAMLP